VLVKPALSVFLLAVERFVVSTRAVDYLKTPVCKLSVMWILTYWPVCLQAYDSQQSSYLSAIASGYGTVASGYGQAAEDSASSTKYPSQTAYYQAASAETPSYYTR